MTNPLISRQNVEELWGQCWKPMGVKVRCLFTPEEIAEGELSETVLVVEDDEDLRVYISDVLRDLNYRVLSARSAHAALTILLQDDSKVDLLLTDVVMPGINGRELGRRAHQIRPGLKILYMTGYSRNAVVHQGRL